MLTDPVDRVILGQALERTFQRCPYYHVRLKNGPFHFYLEELDRKIEPQPDPLYPFPPRRLDDPLMRVRFRDRNISLEMVHVLGDGYGAMTFLKTLLAEYFKAQGVDVPLTHGVLDTEGALHRDEIEDSYRRHFTRKVHPMPRAIKAFYPSGPPMEPGRVAVVRGTMDLQSLLQRTREAKTGVTEYFTSLLAHSLCRAQRDSHPAPRLPVQVFFSTDLRRWFPSKTLRNFAGYGCARIDPNPDGRSFEEMLADIHLQCRSALSAEHQGSLINRDVTIAKNVIFRSLPLFLRRRVVSAMFHLFGMRKSSIFFTNMGAVELPEPIRDKVERFETMADGGEKMMCGVMSYRARLTVSFTRSIENPTVETCFFEMLEREGIPVHVERNF